MKSLFLDTSLNRIVVSILEDDKILFYYNEESDKKLSDQALPIIDRAFQESDILPRDIDTIFIVNGPGSFTGIRVGVTIAKIWGFSFSIKVIPISELELLASTSFIGDIVVPLIDARRGYVYGGIYDHTLLSKGNDCHILLDDFVKKLPIDKKITFVSYDTFDLENVIEPQIDIVRVINKHKDDKGVNPHQLNPNYLKLTEAEENYIKGHACG